MRACRDARVLCGRARRVGVRVRIRAAVVDVDLVRLSVPGGWDCAALGCRATATVLSLPLRCGALTPPLLRGCCFHRDHFTSPPPPLHHPPPSRCRHPRTSAADASIDTEFSGTTCVIGMLRGRTLAVANIGDSRVILGRKEPGARGLKAISISDDHKPDREDEQRRIESRGGRVFAVEYDDGVDGPPRVWLGHLDIPGRAMSRSLGDTVAHTAGVISEPEMHFLELTPADKILIWASDGLWEFMSNQEVRWLDVLQGVGVCRGARPGDLQ